MNKIQGIIFDMDGVIIDSERISFKCFQEVFKEYNYEIDEKFYLKVIGRNYAGIEDIMKKEYGDDFPFETIYRKKADLAYEVTDRDGVIVKPGVHELMDYLKENGYKIAVATSTRRERALQLLEEAKVKAKVDFVVCGDEVENSKPNPEIFLKAAKGLGVKAGKCIVIEDSDAGITAAHAAKMIGIHVPDMKQLEVETKALAFKVCKSLFEVKEYLDEVGKN
ncbi:beta-phosphoglucomutase family hydrolase [Clostridium saccharoperbutylacetonicum]|uniref:Haloacid dehalogenase superfamily, subfamily IA, variant 3 with third motif having DD or ED/haloacid dehalogenase superfamily, subfamily IA, variant 1 with third motif having Dx(3-4)D or Dx(3-4)E n=1 Tax=Clostridium saccharoperbutylacetonicum N1-4(HMT) TaxID=931276 RepID=M1MJ68_9CLOT|nr:HAD family phosphatase [Clostridium saccharoperbutylacetonicum]AGF56368.1 haloacid dehalogenase superfamily, subfamily IA, variant 3 with third motif having DD or ED/haloacid dehalogenase superfamily, subfamily IA, variant 1 with third motif having Dx(3-4)D or Dx(3-4)E [Clostridium saccharoperbutylacetonicum N1-4(HMT)]NRT62888.1 beta-phosphoglucomutase family hydrolase [Clostridium saccharoperbutylacetonicum]NSB26244.1 beta-phosphoglucomutase family hydrolase [Clostridium saccharoperbutylacet